VSHGSGGYPAVPHEPARLPVLPETEVPPQSWRPLGLAFLYTGVRLNGTAGIEMLEPRVGLEAGARGGGGRGAGHRVRHDPAEARPAARCRQHPLQSAAARPDPRGATKDIAKENVARRQQVQLTLVPLPKRAAQGPDEPRGRGVALLVLVCAGGPGPAGFGDRRGRSSPWRATARWPRASAIRAAGSAARLSARYRKALGRGGCRAPDARPHHGERRDQRLHGDRRERVGRL